MERLREAAYDGASWRDIEWKGYDTLLNVSFSNSSPSIGEVSVGEKIIIQGKK